MTDRPSGSGAPDHDIWFCRYVPRPDAVARIVCFGPAGGTPAFFRDWARAVPDDTEVVSLVLPGRERRAAERPLTTMSDLSDAVAQAVVTCMDRPTAFFGHSMGASVAFEVTRRLEKSPGPRPVGLVLSGRPSPRRLLEKPSPVAGFDDAAIIEYLRGLGGTPHEILDDPGFRELILPPCRADFQVTGRYVPDLAQPRVTTPVRVLLGGSDPATPVWDMERWAEVAATIAGTHVLPGGHFYLLDRLDLVVGHVLRTLRGEAASVNGMSAAPRCTEPAGSPAPPDRPGPGKREKP